MIQIVRCELPIMAAHRKRGNLVWEIAVRVLIDESKLIAVMQEISQIVRMDCVDLESLVYDTFVL